MSLGGAAVERSALAWWRRAEQPARRALIAASLGWMLDAFDVMLYALLLVSIRKEFGFGETTAGALQSLTLVASAAGGFIFGVLADRWGRARALKLSVLLYSICTALCGLATRAFTLARPPGNTQAGAVRQENGNRAPASASNPNWGYRSRQ